jgi:hypothetical protein
MNNTMHDFTADLPSKPMNDGSDQARTTPAMHAATTMNAAITNNEYFTAISKRPNAIKAHQHKHQHRRRRSFYVN